MKTSDSITKIAPAILKAQKAITFAAKDATNPHYKSKYADLPSVIDAIKPALNLVGIAFLQTAGTSDPGILAMTTRLLHESGEWIEDTATCPLPKNDPQGYGSACTYLRRYSLAAIVGLYQDDDDGQAASKPKAVIAPATGVWDSMAADEQTFLNDLAGEVRAFITVRDVQKAVEHLESANLGAEEKIAIWTRFDSSERSAMKKYSNSLKEAK
jgi:hypothetical protein